MLSGGFYPGYHFGPTRKNPGDHPSRGRPLPPPAAEFPHLEDPAFERWLRVPPVSRTWANWAALVLLLLGNDIERNPGPRTRAVLSRPALPLRRSEALAPATASRRGLLRERFAIWLQQS